MPFACFVRLCENTRSREDQMTLEVRRFEEKERVDQIEERRGD
jgi:hypothetical protein